MSAWTHIVAAIDVDTYMNEIDIKTKVETMLSNAPKITGSERNADVFVNVLSGYNSFTNCDCNNCKYNSTIEYLEDNSFQCDADENYECPEAEYQSRVVITVVGDLRDRMKDETSEEWSTFKNYIAKSIRGEDGFEIRNCSYTIRGW